MGTVAWPPQEKTNALSTALAVTYGNETGRHRGCFRGGVTNREPRPAGRAVDLHP